MCVCMCVCVCVYVFVYICVYVSVYLCVYVCVLCIYVSVFVCVRERDRVCIRLFFSTKQKGKIKKIILINKHLQSYREKLTLQVIGRP